MIIAVKNFTLLYGEFVNGNKILGHGGQNDIDFQNRMKLGDLNNSAFLLKKLLSVLKHIRELVLEANTNNYFLGNLLKELDNIFEGDGYRELIKILDLLGGFTPEENDFKLLLDLNNSGKISSANIICEDYRKTVNRGFRKNGGLTVLLTDSYDNLLDIVNSYIKTINFKFSYLSDELMFYKAAIRYCEYLKDKEIPSVFPEFCDHTDIKNLRDLSLIGGNCKASDIVPNDFNSKGNNAVLITGDNGSGKTVFLRSLYFALLFGRAGLPITAEFANMPLYNNIAIKFADSDTNISSAVGRFEKEVVALADICNNIEADSVVFFNEIFQSTSYSEAENSLHGIIKALSKRKVKCILVTHLRGLLQYFQEDEADSYVTSSDNSNRFKLIKE